MTWVLKSSGRRMEVSMNGHSYWMRPGFITMKSNGVDISGGFPMTGVATHQLTREEREEIALEVAAAWIRWSLSGEP